jgi:hypothetical protein
MKVLFVTPVESGSGEIITSLHMAENIVAHDDDVYFLSSTFGAYFIEKQFPDRIRVLTPDGERNRELWRVTLDEVEPEVVVFADYPLLFLSSGVAPLADEAWVRSLDDLSTPIVTLDHFVLAQEPMGMFFGPPHLSFHYERFPAIPDRMHIMLPCPLHDPAPSVPRKGRPFRYWDVPLGVTEAKRQEVRRQYVESDDEYLVFHSVPMWAGAI